MEKSAHLDLVLELGNKLVEELMVNSDTLQQWMAHHIAGLIDKASTSSGQEKEQAEQECCATILDLWKVESKFGHIRESLHSIEEITDTIGQLRSPSIWHHVPNGDGKPNLHCTQAISIDRAARQMISFLLLLANEQSEDKQQDWLEFARKLPDGDSSLPIIKFVIVSVALKKLSESEKRADMIAEARDGIAKFRALLDDIEAAVDRAAVELQTPDGVDSRPASNDDDIDQPD